MLLKAIILNNAKQIQPLQHKMAKVFFELQKHLK